MSISRRPWAFTRDPSGAEAGGRTVRYEQRRAVRQGVMAEATLACPACDAPISPGPDGLSVSATLICPFCAARAAVRECLSLARPTRPARVVIRVDLPHPD
jgi:hypothetical protein